MNDVTRFGRQMMLFVLGGVILTGGCAPRYEQQEIYTDALTCAPGNVTLLLENEYVRVTAVCLAPGDRLPTHCLECRVVVALSDYDVLYESPDGSTIREARRCGTVHWHETGIQAIQNVGETDAHYLVVARTENELPPTWTDEAAPGLVEVARNDARVLLENDAIRVTDVTLPMHDTLPRHYEGYAVIYAQTTSELLEMWEHTETSKAFYRVGQAYWQAPGIHAVKNLGRLAHLLVFELKR
jgi:quercetin dioxygenase-like cupin family protein